MNTLYFKLVAFIQVWLFQCKLMLKDQRGVTAVEYALIAAAMAGIILAAVINGGIGTAIDSAFDSVAGALNDAAGVVDSGGETGGGSGNE